MAWLQKNKGYLIHGAAVAVVFLAPSVEHWIGAHPGTAAGVTIAWGWLLHWANGK